MAERPKKLQPAALLAPRAQLQPLAERPEEAEAAATGLTHEAKLQPLAEMPEKLQPAATLSAPRAKLQPLAERPEEALQKHWQRGHWQQQHWARANAHSHRWDIKST